MDTGKGEMVELSPTVAKQLTEAGMPVFHEGEEVLLKGSIFRIKSFGGKFVILELQPR